MELLLHAEKPISLYDLWMLIASLLSCFRFFMYIFVFWSHNSHTRFTSIIPNYFFDYKVHVFLRLFLALPHFDIDSYPRLIFDFLGMQLVVVFFFLKGGDGIFKSQCSLICFIVFWGGWFDALKYSFCCFQIQYIKKKSSASVAISFLFAPP